MDKELAEKAMREAEENFRSNDIEGAKRIVLRAQELFPSLPGLPQMLAAFNVHIAAASKDAKGRTNWYNVLDVQPSDDVNTIKKQFKKLSLLTHPDKNRSSAAEGAFKLVLQAWETISGKASSSEKGPTSPPEEREKGPTSPTSPPEEREKGPTSPPEEREKGPTSPPEEREKGPTGTRGSSSDSGAGDQHGSTSDARSSSRPSSASASASAQPDPKTARSSSARSDPETTWSSSWTRWDPKNSSSRAEVACPKCGRNCKSLDSGDLIIRCSYCNLFAVRGKRDSRIFLAIDEHGPGIF